LGMFRYKNELFLKNHLEAINSNTSVISKSPFDTNFKSFYRTDLTHKVALEEQDKADPELASALTILSKVSEIYGAKLPKSAQRSTHWLALASQDLNRTLEAFSDDSSQWLAKK